MVDAAELVTLWQTSNWQAVCTSKTSYMLIRTSILLIKVIIRRDY